MRDTATKLLVVLLLTVLAACDTSDDGAGGGGPTAPGGPLLLLVASPEAITLFGTSILVAQAFQEAGTPAAEGTVIEFSTTLGRIDQPTAQTDENGAVVVLLRGAEDAGTAIVTARIAGTAASATVEVSIGLGVLFELDANPRVIPTDGSSQIDVFVFNGDGSLPPARTRLDVVTSLGRITDPEPRTDEFGTATTTLEATGERGVAAVRVSLPDDPDSFGEIRVAIGEGRLVLLRATRTSIGVNGSTGLVASIRNFDGTEVGPGVPVRFQTTLGRLDDLEVATNDVGDAANVLQAAGQTGTAEVTAAVDGADEPGRVTVALGTELVVSLSASPRVIASDSQSVLQAVVSNPDGSPAGFVRIQFSADLGRVRDELVTTDSLGVASTIFEADGAAGTATVVAQVVGGEASATITIAIGD